MHMWYERTLTAPQWPLREHVRQHALSEAVVVLAAGSSQILVENAHRPQLSLPMRNALTLWGWLQRDEGATGSSDKVKVGSPGNAHCRPPARARRSKTIFGTTSEVTTAFTHHVPGGIRSRGLSDNPAAACRGTFGANDGVAGGEFDIHRHSRIGCSWLTRTNSSSFEAP